MARAFWSRRGREPRDTPPQHDDLHLAQFDADAVREDEAIEHTHLREDGRLLAGHIDGDVAEMLDSLESGDYEEYEELDDFTDTDTDEDADGGPLGFEERRSIAQHPAGSAAVDPEDTLRALREIYDRVRRDARENASRHKDWDAAIRRAAAMEAEELLANSVLSPGAIREAIRRIELRRTA